MKLAIVLIVVAVFISVGSLEAQEVIIDRNRGRTADVIIDTGIYMPSTVTRTGEPTFGAVDPINYTLGPNDMIEIEVLRHPEFSGRYLINQEGKIQYKAVGDIEVKGLTKAQVADKLKEALAKYVVSPEINISIMEFGSKMFYVLGEVGIQGQFVMRAEAISLRDAIHMAGLPTVNASMRHCRLITPSANGKVTNRNVDLYGLLYGGDLRKNVMIKPGDILYVPSTVMTKVIRTISPVTTVMGLSTAIPETANSGRTAVESIRKKTAF